MTSAYRRPVVILWLLAFVLGAAQVPDTRDATMDPDGIAYLDIAQAYLTRDWNTALSALWPPVYSWLLALFLAVLGPSPRWEFTVVRLVNFATYVAALGCFHLLLRHVIRWNGRPGPSAGRGSGLSEPAWLAIGYALFMWSSLTLITMREDSPDMLVSALVYLTFALLLRIAMGHESRPLFALLGAVLGVGYLTKTFFLQLTALVLAMALGRIGSPRRALPRVLTALALFLCVAGPYTVALSLANGRLTLRDSGRLPYLFNVDRIPWVHWQGELPGMGVPQHPTRKIHEAPAVYEFATPVGGTYPAWHDPVYWNAGAVPRFSAAGHLRSLTQSARLYFETFLVSGGALIVGALALHLLASRSWSVLRRHLAAQWLLLAPALLVMATLPLVQVEATHVGAFVVLFWLGVFSALRGFDAPLAAKCAGPVIAAMVIVLLLRTAGSVAIDAGHTALETMRGRFPWPYDQWQIARTLHEMGIQPGQRVAVIGDGFANSWARLARVRIVAEVPPGDARLFWAADESVKAEVVRRLKSVGVAAIVAIDAPPARPGSPWREIGPGGYHAYVLPEQGRAAGMMEAIR